MIKPTGLALAALGISLIGIAVFVPMLPRHVVSVSLCYPNVTVACGYHVHLEYLSISCQITGAGAWIDPNGDYQFSLGFCG